MDMDTSSASALAVAVVGVIGTLVSALLTQRAAASSRHRELVHVERLRVRRSDNEALRAGYVALNMAARQYLAALTDQVHALRRAADTDAVRRRLAEARDLHRDVHAEAQMRVPDAILDVASEVNHALNAVYGILKRLDGGTPRPGDSLDAAQAGIDELWERLRVLRRDMRVDLGVSRSDSGR